MAKPKKKTETVSFNDRLILFRFFLNKFGCDSLKALAGELNASEYEGLDENNNTWFYGYLRHTAKNNGISLDILRRYDENILRHLSEINENREDKVRLKYFQYIALLFTEFYLDGYFLHTDEFITELNAYLDKIDAETLGSNHFEHYTKEIMNKLAFMCATGSGKTLIMHINIKQYLFYLKIAKRRKSDININNIILLTPNEQLSQQHIDELKLSSIKAQKFASRTSNEKDAVLVIDINKLEEKDGIKTVAVDSFEKNNLVLVDEGHRGLKGNVWHNYRTKLSSEGFSFEYSATFKQALRSQKANEQNSLLAEYGKAIIMDYSYKYFYNDGYGKDYRIYNLKDNITTEQTMTYLTGCLMTFYQQLKLYHTYRRDYAPFRIEMPLLIFVGNRVTSPIKKGDKPSKDVQEMLTDVEQVLFFIDSFVRYKEKTVERIHELLTYGTELRDSNGNELFYQEFEPLEAIFGNTDAETIYRDILHTVFHADSIPDIPRLHIVDLKQVDGELALKIGDNGYFGVISVGDTSALIKKCEDSNLVTDTEEFHSESLFRTINNRDSDINILIGSRKFSEGWNSWRVSTMGLINFGKSEGSQAIQLFGRGVRLKGYEGCLKRSDKTDGDPVIPKFIRSLETLTIFGIKAQYMEDFKKFLELEDVAANENPHEFTLPVVSRFDLVKDKELQVIQLPEKIKNNYKKLSARIVLEAPEEDFAKYLAKNKIVIDCCSKIQTIESDLKLKLQTTIQERHIPKNVIPYLNFQRIYEELEEYKNEKCYYNIIIAKDGIRHIFEYENNGWYSIIIPEKYLSIDSFEKLEAISDYAVMVLKIYLDKFFMFQKRKWESPYLEYHTLTADNNNFEEEYKIKYTDVNTADHNSEKIKKFVDKVNEEINKNGYIENFEILSYHDIITAFDLRRHLYTPFIHVSSDFTNVQITPVTLNKGEKNFVYMLHEFLKNAPSILEDTELYLLRNKSKVGMGFFEAGNFYPDFIMWIKNGNTQRISFIDPKGILHLSPNDPKLEFYKTIKELQARLSEKSNGNQVILNSFIFSATPSLQLREHLGINRLEQEQKHIFCSDQENCISKMVEDIMSDK